MSRLRIAFVLAAVLASAGALSAATPACSPPSPAADDLGWLLRQGPVTVGEEVRLTFRSPALERPAKSGERQLAWRQVIRDPGASYITPHFSHFDLPAGAYTVVRAPDRSRAWRYRGQGKAGLGRGEGFWGLRIPGEAAVVEVWARGAVPAGAVVIDSYARGFKDGIAPTPPDAAICGVDDSEWARCFQLSEPTIYDASRAVARLFINGTSACTGWLVGDEGHVLTNEHCIGSASAALNTDYEFMGEGATCGTNCASFGACPGTVVANSATLVRSNASLDYTLVQLPSNPVATYGFLQLRASGPAVDERIYIPGHPGAWGKRISVTSSDSTDPSGFCEVFSLNEPPCSGGPGDTGYFCDTQGGSSGSPVIAYSDHLVVSLHHCAFCPNRGVPIEAVIEDLGNDLPNNAIGDGGPPPPPPPPPPCLAKKEPCVTNAECCSGKCKGKAGSKTCK